MGWGALGWNGDDGPNPLSAWSRAQMGWVRMQDVTAAEQELRLRPVAAGGTVSRIALGPRESFLLAYRNRTASHYDRNLPGEGLLVWHVSGDVEEQFAVDLECADGRWREAGYPDGHTADPQGGDNLDFWAHDDTYRGSHGGNLGDATDPFDGERFSAFTTDTNPAAKSLDGRLGVRIEQIAVADGELMAEGTIAACTTRCARRVSHRRRTGRCADSRRGGCRAPSADQRRWDSGA